jgi:predicted alpha/beta-fold hydrolase
VGEEGANCPLKAAIAVGNPFDLEIANKALQRTALGRLYSRVMGCKLASATPSSHGSLTSTAANMKRLIDTHKDAVLKHTNLNFDKIQTVTYLHEFDREVQ